MKKYYYLFSLIIFITLISCIDDSSPDPYAGNVSLSVSSGNVTEGSSFEIQFSLDNPNGTNNAIGLAYLITGTANGDDHSGASGIITIPVQESSASRLVEVYEDSLQEGTEFIFIEIDEMRLPSGVEPTESISATVQISDND